MSISEKYRKECFFYIALGYFRLEDYAKSREYMDILLAIEPHHRQARTLKVLIEQRVAREGIIGMAIVGGLIVVAVGAFAMTLFRRRSSS
jgi:mitochondrial fission 1 protein